MKNILIKSIGFVLATMLMSCVEGREFGTLEANCTTDIKANISFAKLDSLVQDDVVQIQEDWVMEGYVISSDQAGNFFNVLYLQDSPANPSGGIRLEMDLRESHLLYPVGSKVYIKLKELYLDRRGSTLEL